MKNIVTNYFGMYCIYLSCYDEYGEHVDLDLKNYLSIEFKKIVLVLVK